MNVAPEHIKIIYEDNHLLVIEKPVNMPSQKDETNDPDVLSLMKEYIKRKYNKPGNVYLGLVHRLDRPVGGVMVLAKTSKSASRLSEQVRNRHMKKVYLCVVHGRVEPASSRLVHYLIKDNSKNIVKAYDKEVRGAKEAILDYKVEAYYDNFSLVRVFLHTGRPHQIRVQLAAIGHHLYGDMKYGTHYMSGTRQLALWSTQITVCHPTLKTQMVFESTPPQEAEPWVWFSKKDGAI